MKCRFKHTTREDQLHFSESSCLLTISVGQAYHEGEQFEATIDLINKSFRQCKIMLYDTLQRHTMALNTNQPASHFYNQAKNLGDDWLQRNKTFYQKLSNLSDIIRWDRWLDEQDFQAQKSCIENLIKADTVYRQAFYTTRQTYLDRYVKRITHAQTIDFNHAQSLCLDYLIEECAALCLWPRAECEYDIYPSRRNPAMQSTYDHFIKGKTLYESKPVMLRFTRGQMPPQTFKKIH